MRIFTIIFCLFLSVNAIAQTRDTMYVDSNKKLVLKNGDKKAYIEIDGKVYNGRLESIDTATISSIDVLKPVDAASIYGPPAADGAVLITTKKTKLTPGTLSVIRCMASISNSAEPLYVINGKISKDGIKTINPNDILSIDVLKGISATAIYGTGGVNGVVIIKTKAFAISLYQKKLSALSKKYKKYLLTHNNDDAAIFYVINGEVINDKPDKLNSKLNKLADGQIKSVDFFEKWSKTLNNEHALLIITTKSL